MECFLLYLDDLDDWFFALALAGERIRRRTRRLGLLAVGAVVQVLAVILALRNPALGAALAALLTVAVLYRSATAPFGDSQPA